MSLTAEELEKVKELAGLFLSPEEIAVLLEKDVSLFLDEYRDKNSDLFRAYRLGHVISKRDIRMPVLRMAKHGSPQAEMLADKYISEHLLSELDE